MILVVGLSAGAVHAGGYWPLDSSVDGVTFDRSVCANHGTIVGPERWVAGASGRADDRALAFDGKTYVDLGNDNSLIQGLIYDNAMTMAFWVKLTATEPMEICKTLNNGNGLVIAIFSGWARHRPSPHSLLFELRDDAGQYWAHHINKPGLFDGKWHHLAWVVEDSVNRRARVYVDGSEAAVTHEAEGSPAHFSRVEHYLPFGACMNRGKLTTRFKGAIDEIAVFDRALAKSEIADLIKGKLDVISSINSKKAFIESKNEASRYGNLAIDRAMRGLKAGIPAAQADNRLPIYHFRPPAQWLGDINGPIYHKGYYHVFYQHNPYRPRFGTVHWGHARSRDLVHWEHMPIALWPSTEKGEQNCYSGATVINDVGQPMIFYTSVPSFDQWAAVGDDELIRWKKHPDNPILPKTLHSDQVRIGAWRDPFIFQHEGSTYLICGGSDRGRGITSLYRAENREFTEWKYLGPLYHHRSSPDNACPNFFQVGDKCVMFVSRHKPHVLNYLVGTWDLQTYRFHPEYAETLDYGEDTYATQGLNTPDGRLIIWSTVHAYRSWAGWIDWPGCASLPRVVTIRPDGLLGIAPAAEVKRLRGKHGHIGTIRLSSSTEVLKEAKGDAIEMIAEFTPGDAKAFGLKVRMSDDGKQAVTIRYDEEGLEVNGVRGFFNPKDNLGPFKMLPQEKQLSFHLFLDKAVLELYVNGRACITRLIEHDEKNQRVAVFAEGGTAVVKSIDWWEVNSIWGDLMAKEH